METENTALNNKEEQPVGGGFIPPRDEELNPQGNEPVSQDNESIPQANEPVPQDNEPVPQANEPIPQGVGPIPQDNELTPQDNEIKPQKKSFLRRSGKWTDIFLIAGLLSFLLILAGESVSLILLSAPLGIIDVFTSIAGSKEATAFLLQYFDFIGIWIVFIFVITIFRDNRPMWKAFFYNGHGNNLKAIPIGILLGGGMNGFCILMAWLQGDIKLSFNEFKAPLFFLFLLCVMIQSGAEEIMDRCYLYQKMRRRYRWPALAILFNAFVFMALHMANPGVTKLGLLQVFMIGVLFSLIVYYFDSLWTVIWAHTAWNFSQSIVFGLPNSGIVSMYSVFKLDAASARDGIFYNTSFGVEGSLGANILIAAVTLLVLIFGIVRKRGERKDHWKEMEEAEPVKRIPWEPFVLVIIMLGIIAAALFFFRSGYDDALLEEALGGGTTAEMAAPDEGAATEGVTTETGTGAATEGTGAATEGTGAATGAATEGAGAGAGAATEGTGAGTGAATEGAGAGTGAATEGTGAGTGAATEGAGAGTGAATGAATEGTGTGAGEKVTTTPQ